MFGEENNSNNNLNNKSTDDVNSKDYTKSIHIKFSKKFDPFQYFKNEYLQSHQNKSSEELEKV